MAYLDEFCSKLAAESWMRHNYWLFTNFYYFGFICKAVNTLFFLSFGQMLLIFRKWRRQKMVAGNVWLVPNLLICSKKFQLGLKSTFCLCGPFILQFWKLC